MSQTTSSTEEPLALGDVVKSTVDGAPELGIITGHQPRMKPPRYLRFDLFDVLFYPGYGPSKDGMELNGCSEDGAALKRASPKEVAELRERLEAMEEHGDLKERSLAALQLLRRREMDLSVARGEPEPMPTPHVVKPTLAQLVKGARVEWKDSKGKLWNGWVHDFGVWPDIFNHEEPPAPRVSIESCRPGKMPMSMAMPDTVPLDRVLRSTCLPDPSPEACWKCKQSGEPKGGEAPCPTCHRPTMHDPGGAA